MNRAYRLVWNMAKEAWVVAAESVKVKFGGRPSLMVKAGAVAALLVASLVVGSPHAGAGNIVYNGGTSGLGGVTLVDLFGADLRTGNTVLGAYGGTTSVVNNSLFSGQTTFNNNIAVNSIANFNGTTYMGSC